MKENNRFISSFVNAMYSILIGIGVGNIIFHGDFDLRNIPIVLMTLFVTGVVLLYWWDWTEFIEKETSSTKLEFFIDFILLIALEMLFVYYNKPSELAVVFIAIGFIDFIWVINHLFELKKSKGNYSRHQMKWIVEKVLCIILYATSYGLINYFQGNLLFQYTCIVVTFIIVRKIGFISTKIVKRIIFCKADTNNIKEIVQINNEYFDEDVDIDDKGFLLKKYTYKEIKRIIEEDSEKIYIAKDAASNVLGYIHLQRTIDADVIQDVTWINKDISAQFNDLNYYYVAQIAVSKDQRKNGIGKFLYRSLFDTLQTVHFFGFIMINPIKNAASVNFHEANNYEMVGLFERDHFEGFDNYKSLLYYRKAKRCV